VKRVAESAEVSHNNRRWVIGRVASFGGKKEQLRTQTKWEPNSV